MRILRSLLLALVMFTVGALLSAVLQIWGGAVTQGLIRANNTAWELVGVTWPGMALMALWCLALTGYVLARHLKREAVPEAVRDQFRMVAEVSSLLGLLGTCLGMTAATQPLGRLTDPAEIISAMGPPVGAALYSTVCGLLLGLWSFLVSEYAKCLTGRNGAQAKKQEAKAKEERDSPIGARALLILPLVFMLSAESALATNLDLPSTVAWHAFAELFGEKGPGRPVQRHPEPISLPLASGPLGLAEVRALIHSIAGREAIDGHLAEAVARVESGLSWWSGAAGEVGFFQLMEAAGREVGVDRHDPVQNIVGGIRYLKNQLIRFGPEPQGVARALSAYNCGPTSVAQGRIPPQTRHYVRRVIQTYYQIKGAERR